MLSSRKARDFAIYGFGQAVNLISPLLVIPHIVAVCGESGLGKAGVGFSFALIAIVLVDAGSYINGTKEISIFRSDITKLGQKVADIYLAKLMLLVAVLTISVLVIYAVPFFRRDKLQLLLSLLIVAGQFLNPAWFFQGIQNFIWISAVNVLSKIIYVVAVFMFINAPADYTYVNAFLGIGSIVAAVPGIIWMRSRFKISFYSASPKNAVALIRQEWVLSLSQLFFSLYQYAPIMLISFLLGDQTAGQYRIIDQAVMIFRTYLQMFFNFIYADVCAKIYENITGGLKAWRKYNYANTAFILILLLLVYFNTSHILLFFKVEPQDIDMMENYFRIGLLVPVVMCGSFALKQLMFATDKNRQYIIITVASTVATFAIMALLLKTAGLKGAFISILLIETSIIIAYTASLRKILSSLKA
ncbi:MAG TPA: oligosaccharide flippase family protein [Flavobacterium sp.]|jgi:O-antigen/teichoic acid export membrane protein